MDTRTLSECTHLSLAGQITFPEVVARLKKTGIERYYADLIRMEKIYYSQQDDTHVEKMPLASRTQIADEFDEPDVADAVKSIQKGEIDYPEFLKRIMASGSVGYSVFLRGAQSVYYGRKGEQHVERFPVTSTV